MDQRIEAFLADVLALAGENPDKFLSAQPDITGDGGHFLRPAVSQVTSNANRLPVSRNPIGDRAKD